MKKCILMMLALLGAVQILSAVPARPGKFTRILPDGRTVTLELHGDEFRHWLTDASGQVVKDDGNGFFVPSSMDEVEVVLGGGAEVNRSRMEQLDQTRRLLRRAAPTRSAAQAIHFPMILVQFPDLGFSIAETDELVWQAFNNLANQVGYSAHGGTGSIHDFYAENSMNQTDFHFDVYGPVTVSQPAAYYGTKITGPRGIYYEPAAEALMEAVRILSAQGVDFDPYDNDGNGRVDATFMFYAGFNEAEGAPEETIWPHNWSVGSWDTALGQEVFGHVRFGTYSCTSEKRGTPGSDKGMCGIGTAVHEFGHALGLPDFYDTNYNRVGDGECGGIYTFSPMCSGSYNNNGRTPPYFTMEERIMLGWSEGFTTMPASGTITIPSVDTNVAFKEETDNPGEYFVFECRKGAGWDAFIPGGMVVYHVDKSANQVVIYNDSGQGITTTAADIWQHYSSYINTTIVHPCYYAVPATDQGNLNFSGAKSQIPFPGSGAVSSYKWQGWAADNRQGDIFTGITFNPQAGTVTMHREGVSTGLVGRVTTTDGTAVSGASVCIYAGYFPAGETVQSPDAPSGAPKRIARHTGQPVRTVETGTDGSYLASLEGLDLSGEVTVEVSAQGYMDRVEHVTLVQRAVVTQNFEVLRIGQPVYGTLAKFVGSGTVVRVGFNSTEARTQMAAIRFTEEELAPYAGCRVAGLNFRYHLGADATLTGVKGIIDFGSQRVLVADVPSSAAGVWNYLDVTAEDLHIPENTKCYFGYALTGCTEPYPFYYYEESAVGGMYLKTSSGSTVPSTPSWSAYSNGVLMISVVLENGAVLQFNYIASPGGTYAVGSTLDLNLIQVSGDRAPGTDIAWYYDDEPVSGTVTFSKTGRHVLEARFTTVAGKRKVVEMEVTVQ